MSGQIRVLLVSGSTRSGATNTVRLVLAELTERIGIALKKEAELNAAISRLTDKK